MLRAGLKPRTDAAASSRRIPRRTGAAGTAIRTHALAITGSVALGSRSEAALRCCLVAYTTVRPTMTIPTGNVTVVTAPSDHSLDCEILRGTASWIDGWAGCAGAPTAERASGSPGCG